MRPTNFANGFSGAYVANVDTVSDTAYTFQASDAAAYVRFTSATAVTATVPPDAATVPSFDIGKEITFEQAGAGAVTVVAGAGVTIHAAGSFSTSAQYDVVTLKKVGADTWTLSTGAGAPGGPSGAVQFNASGSLSGDADFEYAPGGTATLGGAATLKGADSATTVGTNLLLRGGSSTAGAGHHGGDADLFAGDNTSASGGTANVRGGNYGAPTGGSCAGLNAYGGQANGAGGNIFIYGGYTSASSSQSAGIAQLTGGTSNGTGSAGEGYVFGGVARGTAGNGGNAGVFGGYSQHGNGGKAKLYAGAAKAGTGNGGSVYIASGTSVGGTAGDIFFKARSNYLVRSKTTLADGSGVGAGTLTNAPAAGNPTKWIAIDDNGTVRHFPAW